MMGYVICGVLLVLFVWWLVKYQQKKEAEVQRAKAITTFSQQLFEAEYEMETSESDAERITILRAVAHRSVNFFLLTGAELSTTSYPFDSGYCRVNGYAVPTSITGFAIIVTAKGDLGVIRSGGYNQNLGDKFVANEIIEAFISMVDPYLPDAEDVLKREEITVRAAGETTFYPPI